MRRSPWSCSASRMPSSRASSAAASQVQSSAAISSERAPSEVSPAQSRSHRSRPRRRISTRIWRACPTWMRGIASETARTSAAGRRDVAAVTDQCLALDPGPARVERDRRRERRSPRAAAGSPRAPRRRPRTAVATASARLQCGSARPGALERQHARLDAAAAQPPREHVRVCGATRARARAARAPRCASAPRSRGNAGQLGQQPQLVRAALAAVRGHDQQDRVGHAARRRPRSAGTPRGRAFPGARHSTQTRSA